MKRATRGFLSFASAFLIVFSTFGNAFLVAEASEPTAIEETVTVVDSNAEVISDANAATVGASKEETVTGDVTGEGKTSEETEEIREEADTETVVETTVQKSVDLTVTASEQDGYVTLPRRQRKLRRRQTLRLAQRLLKKQMRRRVLTSQLLRLNRTAM